VGEGRPGSLECRKVGYFDMLRLILLIGVPAL